MAKVLMKGNEAIAQAAIEAGCRFFAGYPITPQNEIPEYMSRVMPKVDGVFVQAESEVSAINMVYGAASAGARAMTSSSSPGVSLKQEGISYMVGSELPCLIVNIMRGGPGLGSIQPSQGDYYQSTRGGGHGDYRLPVLAPASLQEAVELTQEAFDIADLYRTPVMLIGDGMLGQMMEPVEFGTYTPRPPVDKSAWATTGRGERAQRNIVTSLYIEPEVLEQVNLRLAARYALIGANETRVELYNTDGAQVLIAAYGTTARIAKSAIALAAAKGIKVGLVRPITVWPFPMGALHTAATQPSVQAVLTVEMSLGQMVDDVRLAVGGAKPVHFFGRAGGMVPMADDILAQILRIVGGE